MSDLICQSPALWMGGHAAPHGRLGGARTCFSTGAPLTTPRPIEAVRPWLFQILRAGSIMPSHCEACGKVLTLRVLPAHLRRYCNNACKMRAWWQTHEKKHYPDKRPHKPKPIKARLVKAPKSPPACVQCGQPCPSGSTKTCSPACRSARMRAVLTGKKYRPMKVHQNACHQCGGRFVTTKQTATVCPRCLKRGRGKYRERCRRAGVPYLPGVTPLKVFTRDRYRCQLCGVKTPKRLRGTNEPNAPELDHIIPINAVGGSPGHVWENVQCACRQCNNAKSAKPLGQLRLA